MIMSDAFWVALFGCVTSGVGAFFSFRSVVSSKANKTAIDDVRSQVNGNLHAAVAEAKESAKRNIPPQVLVIDDCEDDLLLARIPLHAYGCEVFTARTGSAAVILIATRVGSGRGYPFDFVLLDMRLIGEDIKDVIMRLESIAPRVPIVILTGYSASQTLVHLCADVPRMWITKPLQQSHVKSLLEQFGVPYYTKP